ncbi:MAG: hypothetical protein HDT48_00415 [Ruminococcaceae bacterium]|nr:hypothetical protein [Oscillospiraceae bacterium]
MIKIRNTKVLTTLLSVSLSIFLTACNTNETHINTNSTLPNTTTDSSLSTDEQSTAYSTSSAVSENTEYNSNTIEKNDLQAALEEFSIDSFIAPDGSEHSISEAVAGYYDPTTFSCSLTFDFAYIRYAQPIYFDTDSDPEIYNFENRKYDSVSPFTSIEKPKYFQISAGQTLANGLTVSKACFTIYPANNDKGYNVAECETVLEGTFTMNGIIFKYSKDPQFIYTVNDVLFYADPTANEYIPTAYAETNITLNGADNKFAFIGDTPKFFLGNINDIDIDLSNYFTEGDFTKVKATVTDVVIRYFESGGGNRSSCTLIDIESI